LVTDKEFGNGLFATGFDVPYSGNLQICFNKVFLKQYQQVLIIMMNEDCPILQEVNMIKGKYLFSAMIRRDASTRFGPGNKVGYFHPSPRVGLFQMKFF
jgi:hypothetical protein